MKKYALILFVCCSLALQAQDTSTYRGEFKISKHYDCLLEIAGKTPIIDSRYPGLGAKTDTITIAELLNAGKVTLLDCIDYKVLSFQIKMNFPDTGQANKTFNIIGESFPNEFIKELKSFDPKQHERKLYITIDNISYKTPDEISHFIKSPDGFGFLVYK